MFVCTGDLSQKNFKQYDIETWMPSRNGYGETHSSSILLDFQARRSNIRYRDKDGELRFCHTLNNTAVATPRILIPLLENHQRSDGSVHIPKALRRYMNGLEELYLDILPMPKGRGFQRSHAGFPASLRLAFSSAFQLSSGSYGLSTG